MCVAGGGVLFWKKAPAPLFIFKVAFIPMGKI